MEFIAKNQNLVIENLPDGSVAVFDAESGAVHALNAQAAAALRACGKGSALPAIALAMSRELQTRTDDAAALEALSQLDASGLVQCVGKEKAAAGPSRRSIFGAAAAALPVVLTLTAAQQKAYARLAGSGVPSITAFELISGSLCSMSSGNSLTFRITGENTHFASGTTVVTSVRSGFSIGTVTVVSATVLTVAGVTTTGDMGEAQFRVVTGAEDLTTEYMYQPC
jgi:PqqD family protein of HPr-rel-A system